MEIDFRPGGFDETRTNVIFWIVLIVLIVGLGAFFVFLTSRFAGSPATGKATTTAPRRPPQARPVDPVAARHGPPPSAAGNSLEVLQGALAEMEIDVLENILESGAHLKEGAEDLIRDELKRRREKES